MKIQQLYLLFFHSVICFCLLGFAGARNRNLSKSPLSRSSFPDGFIFGAASSAYQSEGAAKMYGRGPSIWDIFTEEPGKIVDNSNADVADDFYHRYKGDISLMKEVGLDSFRISFSWSRILPKGKISGGVNWEGVGFYNSLIDVLLENGIQPLVTLLHWDLPQALEDDYKGLLSPQIVDDFRDYANFCFKEFGDRVKFWATVNEPNLYTIFAYDYGQYAPGRCSDYMGNCMAGNSATEPYIVVHHLLLSHATAVKLYKENYQAYQNGKIGLTVFTIWMVPKFETAASVDASSRALDFLVGWIMHPLTYGDYPKSMRYLVGYRLPKFTETEAKLLKGSFDFIGMNYYTSYYADNVTSYNTVNLSYTTDSRVNITYYKNGVPIGEPTTCYWLFIYPKGIREMLLYLKRKYNNPVIYITENGFADNSSLPLIDILDDVTRIKYYRLHLLRVIEAIKEGVDVRGYYAWSFLDDFEWNFGYTLRFGLTYVDYKQGLKRYPKHSFLWFKELLKKESYSLLYSE